MNHKILKCVNCDTDLHRFDIRMQDCLKGVCLICGENDDWEGLGYDDRQRCIRLMAYLNMGAEQARRYDANRGS